MNAKLYDYVLVLKLLIRMPPYAMPLLNGFKTVVHAIRVWSIWTSFLEVEWLIPVVLVILGPVRTKGDVEINSLPSLDDSAIN
jgi:hypothetical protein